MSEYGLLIKNSNNEVQIDSTYQNLSFDQSGSSSISSPKGGGGTSISITPSPLIPLCIFQPSSTSFCQISSYGQTNSNYDSIEFMTESQTSATINWQVYRENLSPSSDTYGLKIYNSANKLCYDSGKHYFKIKEIHSGISLGSLDGSTSPSYVDITSSISDPYCILLPSNNIWTTFSYNGSFTMYFYWRCGLKKISSTVIRVGGFANGTFTAGGAPIANNFTPSVNDPLTLIICE